MLIVASVACGSLGWSGNVLALPVAMLFPALWAMSPSRTIAVLVSAGYFLAASRGLPQGVANFYSSDLWPGFLLWMAASVSFVAVHAAAWTRQTGKGRAVRYLAAAVLMALPPFGITGWAHPLTAAGVVFPGWGWWGLAAAAAGLFVMMTRHWPAAAIGLGGFWLWSAATWTEPNLPEGWRGVDLQLGQMLGRDASLDQHRGLIATARIAASQGARVVVFPESTLGFWTPTVARLWREGLNGLDVTVVAGAAVIDAQGYDNVMVAVGSGAAGILYKERMPVPVSMWRPWLHWTGQGGGAQAHLFANPVVEVGTMRIAPLICYEQLLLWPMLQSMLYSPAVIVATGNGWWTRGTSIVAIQKASVTAWARLFGLPVVMAFNTYGVIVMVDAVLIQQCANPDLKPAIVEQFIERAGSEDPLAVTVSSGNRVVLVPKPATPADAMELIRQNLGRNVIRVGITQYPAGLGIMESGGLKPDLVEPCENLRMGTALFAKVYRIVMKWYGNPTEQEVLPEVLDDAIIAWRTGYFEGTAVFRAPDTGKVEVPDPENHEPASDAVEQSADPAGVEVSNPAEDEARGDDPNKAGIRVDLSGIGADRP